MDRPPIEKEPLCLSYNRGMKVPEQQRSVAADEVKHLNLTTLLIVVVKKVTFTAVINDIESDRPK